LRTPWPDVRLQYTCRMITLRDTAGPILELTSEWAYGDKQLGNRTEDLIQDAHQTTERGVHTVPRRKEA
jgi:hypothetical protein